MASAYTMRILIHSALYRADLLRLNADGDTEEVDSVFLDAVGHEANAELAALWDVLISASEDYCIKHLTIDVVAGVENYSLPSDFYKFRKVFSVQNGKRCSRLKRFDLNRLGAADSLAAIATGPIEQAKYRISGNRLWLHPAPTSAAALELWYIPQFDPLLNLDDKIDFRFPVGWEQYVIEGVAARCLEREESDSSAQRSRQKEILQRILILVEDRDVGEPHQMQDVEGYLDGWY